MNILHHQQNKSTLTTLPAQKKLKTPQDTLSLIIESLEASKAEDIVTIDLTGKTALTDYMLITSGRSNRHVNAITNQLLRTIKENGFKNTRIEGLPACDWVLVDIGDIIIHIFRPEVREFYNIEKVWSENRPNEDA